MRRFRALMRKEFTHMRRDPRTLILIFIMPIMQLLLLGYATNSDVKNVSTVIFDQDNSQASRALIGPFEATGYFSMDYVAYNEKDVYTLMDSGKAHVAIIIPPGYGSDLAAGRKAEVAVLIDGADPTVAAATLSAATLVGQSRSTAIRTEKLSRMAAGAANTTAPVEVHTRVLYNPDLLSAYNMVPALIAMILMMTTVNLTSGSIVRERESGTIEQLIVTPIRNLELVVAKITPYVLVMMGNVILILMVGNLWFKVPIRGNLMMLLALTALYLLPNLGLGLLISTFAHTQQQAQMMVMPVMLPSMMLSGFFYPVAALPPFLQLISACLPLTYYLFIVRSVVIRGATLDMLIAPILVLLFFSALMMGMAALRFKKSLD
jgi:ABC-2 type transport system permease protein